MRYKFIYLLFATALLALHGCKKDVPLAFELTGYQKMNTVTLQSNLVSGLYAQQVMLQRSSDSIHFETIQTIQSTSPTVQWTDSTAVPYKINYYRVCSSGFCSNVVAIDYFLLNQDGVNAHPNPANSFVNLGFYSPTLPYEVTVYDRWGQIVYTRKNVTEIKILVDVSQYLNGTYIALFHNGVNTATIVFAVIH